MTTDREFITERAISTTRKRFVLKPINQEEIHESTKYRKMVKRERLRHILMNKISWKSEIIKKRFILTHPVIKLLENNARNIKFNEFLYSKNNDERLMELKDENRTNKLKMLMNSKAIRFMISRRQFSVIPK